MENSNTSNEPRTHKFKIKEMTAKEYCSIPVYKENADPVEFKEEYILRVNDSEITNSKGYILRYYNINNGQASVEFKTVSII